MLAGVKGLILNRTVYLNVQFENHVMVSVYLSACCEGTACLQVRES